MSTTTCPLCSHDNDPSAFIGTLGSVSHYRCRSCGALYEADPPDNPSSGDDDEGSEDDTCSFCDEPATITDGDLRYCDDCYDDVREADDDPRDRPDPELY